jgi:hypothetical protein
VKGLAGLGAVRASGIKDFSISHKGATRCGLAYPHVFRRVIASLENPIKRPCEAGVLSQARPGRAPESAKTVAKGGRARVEPGSAPIVADGREQHPGGRSLCGLSATLSSLWTFRRFHNARDIAFSSHVDLSKHRELCQSVKRIQIENLAAESAPHHPS